jgi:hypothetical protein
MAGENIFEVRQGEITMKTINAILFITMTMFLSSCYQSITGTVVDAETGQPIEGAVVLVEWTKTKGFGLTYTESYKVAETLTDKEGKFVLPGCYSSSVNAPHVTIYKKGYVAWNNEFIFPDYKKRSDFIWQKGDMLKLEKFNPAYTHDAHIVFINTVIRSTLAYEKKRQMINAFEWETDLARAEVKKTGK